MNASVYEYLMRDRLANIDMLEILPLPGAEVVCFSENGVLLRHDGLYLLAAEPSHSAEFLPPLTDGLTAEDERMIVLRNGELTAVLQRVFGFQLVMECRHAVYPGKTPPPYALPEDTQIRRLDLSHLGFVHAHYKMVDDLDYLRERIEDCMFGVFVRDEIVGFAGTHDERSMGLLEILPEYRRLGLAYALEAHLIKHLLELGRTPFCQVSIRNEPSIALQEKIGMEFSTAVIHWLVRGRVR